MVLTVRWHPLRARNAVNVRVFGVDLLVVHIQLHVAGYAELPADSPAEPR